MITCSVTVDEPALTQGLHEPFCEYDLLLGEVGLEGFQFTLLKSNINKMNIIYYGI